MVITFSTGPFGGRQGLLSQITAEYGVALRQFEVTMMTGMDDSNVKALVP